MITPYYIDYSEFEKKAGIFRGRRNSLLRNDLKDPYRDFLSSDRKPNRYHKCIYCDTPLIIDSDLDLSCVKTNDESPATLGSTYTVKERLKYCPQCYWWSFSGLTDHYIWPGEGSEGRDYETNELRVTGKIKTFNLKEEEIPLQELRSWLARHPDNLAHTNPFAFEKLMADCFKDLFPESEVLHVGKKSNDNGVDIKIILNNKQNILVQVKRREKLNMSEGVQTIRELNGVLLREGVAHGIVVTTAKNFSIAAIRETNVSESVTASAPFEKYKVDLIAYSDVVNLLQIQKKDRSFPWRQHVSVFQDIPERDRILKMKDS